MKVTLIGVTPGTFSGSGTETQIEVECESIAISIGTGLRAEVHRLAVASKLANVLRELIQPLSRSGRKRVRLLVERPEPTKEEE